MPLDWSAALATPVSRRRGRTVAPECRFFAPAVLVLAGLAGFWPAGDAGAEASSCALPPPAFWPQRLAVEPGVYRLEATVVRGQLGQSLLAEGDVRLFREGLRVDAATLAFDVAANRLEAPGPSVFFDGAVRLAGQDLELEPDSRRGRLETVRFSVSPPWMRSSFTPLTSVEALGSPPVSYRDAPESLASLLQLAQPLPGRGTAALALHTGPDRFRLEDARYTTCPPEAEHWAITAKSLEIDTARGRGEARDVRLRLGGIPVFYTPYLDFPIDDRRKTGFLYPSLRQSSRSGWGLSLPFYWNLAPNRDLTFTPRFESRRGVLLDTESRYLFRSSEGRLDAAYLPGDRLFGDDRHAVRWQHRSRLRPDLRLEIDAGDVSDAQYFEDFGTTLTDRTTRTVERRADLTLAPSTPFAGAFWQVFGRVQAFQILDDVSGGTEDPYRRLPQVRLNAQSISTSPLAWTLRSELVRFDRRQGPVGNRLDLDFQVYRRLEDWGYFVEPRLRLRHTRYDLQEIATRDTAIQRTTVSGQVDAGLTLTRPLGTDHRQTLEPRLFYGYVPFRRQDDIPLFDTDETAFGANRLFTLDRFTGSDRVGDTHQLTAALTTRVITEATGRQRLSLAGGQVHYLSERRVRAKPGAAPLPEGASDWFVSGQVNLGEDWDLETTLVLDPSGFERKEESVAARYRSGPRQANLVYRARAAATRQVDFSVYSPLGPRVSLIGRWHYDVDARRALDVVAGLEYRSCCFTVRGAINRKQIGDMGRYDDAILLQLTLSGLGRIDTGLQSLLRDVIPGYE